jgi:desampylase
MPECAHLDSSARLQALANVLARPVANRKRRKSSPTAMRFRCQPCVNFGADHGRGIAVVCLIRHHSAMLSPINLSIPHSVINQLIAVALASPTEEVCGLLFGGASGVERAEPTANVAADPARRFEVDPGALIAAHRQGRGEGAKLIGHYHSHPNGRAEPSVCDAKMAIADGSIWVIVAGGDVTAWRAVEDGALHGRFDPLPILRC